MVEEREREREEKRNYLQRVLPPAAALGSRIPSLLFAKTTAHSHQKFSGKKKYIYIYIYLISDASPILFSCFTPPKIGFLIYDNHVSP